MSTYIFEDESGIARLEGTLSVKQGQGALNDVPKQGADGKLSQAVGGGSTAGAAIVRGPFSFTFATANLAAGVAVYTPTVADLLLDVLVVVDTVWDGTTPLLDVGTAVGTTNGILNFYGGAVQMDIAPDDETPGTGILFSSTPGTSLVASAAESGWFRAAGIVTAVNPLKVWVSQDGSAGGADPGASQGAARLYVVTATPVALP